MHNRSSTDPARVDAELDRLQEEGILQPVKESRWAAPIVVVRKSDGNIRICGDYKVTVNTYLEPGTYPMPNPRYLFATLAGGKRFTRLDMKQAYQQMKVDKESQKYLTINTNKGLFTYTRMPFGISTAPGIWQRAMDSVLAGVPGVICYLDDILIVGDSDEQHEERLRMVLDRLDQAGVRLKREKCEFHKTSVEYLGHVIGEQGLKPTDSKVKAIKEAPEPSNVTELRAFLGLLNYYGQFLPNIAATLHPLYVLLQKGQPWMWKTEQKMSFHEAKQKLIQSDFLVHNDLTKVLKLNCDASPYGVGACLVHVMEDGSERPVAFASRTLSNAEKNYAQLEREALALIFGVRQFHKYLVGREFTLVTDHKPLLKILGPYEGVPTLAASRLQRWALILSAYKYRLQYKPGTDNKEADLLSRLPLPVQVIDPNEQIYGLDYCEQLPVTAAEVAKETLTDPVLKKVYQYTMFGWTEPVDKNLEPYQRRASELSTENGCLLWGNRVVIPTTLRSRLLEELHEGHLGIVRMKAVARSLIWWAGMDSEVEEVTKTCQSCQSQMSTKQGESVSSLDLSSWTVEKSSR